ncbi:unnamed protein product, partial [Meganyctiphanes norvegica]
RKYHKFAPINESKIKVFEIYSDENGEEKCIQKKDKLTFSSSLICQPKNGDFFVCTYNHLKWIGLVDSYNDKFENFGISFLFPSGYCKYYYFPEMKDFCHVIKENILGILTSPNLKAGTSRIQYKFMDNELKK